MDFSLDAEAVEQEEFVSAEEGSVKNDDNLTPEEPAYAKPAKKPAEIPVSETDVRKLFMDEVEANAAKFPPLTFVDGTEGPAVLQDRLDHIIESASGGICSEGFVRLRMSDDVRRARPVPRSDEIFLLAERGGVVHRHRHDHGFDNLSWCMIILREGEKFHKHFCSVGLLRVSDVELCLWVMFLYCCVLYVRLLSRGIFSKANSSTLLRDVDRETAIPRRAKLWQLEKANREKDENAGAPAPAAAEEEDEDYEDQRLDQSAPPRVGKNFSLLAPMPDPQLEDATHPIHEYQRKPMDASWDGNGPIRNYPNSFKPFTNYFHARYYVHVLHSVV